MPGPHPLTKGVVKRVLGSIKQNSPRPRRVGLGAFGMREGRLRNRGSTRILEPPTCLRPVRLRLVTRMTAPLAEDPDGLAPSRLCEWLEHSFKFKSLRLQIMPVCHAGGGVCYNFSLSVSIVLLQNPVVVASARAIAPCSWSPALWA